jgi:cytochrome b561
VFNREEQPPEEPQENDMNAKATSIAIITFMYLALFALGLLGYIFIAAHKGELDTFRIIVGGALTMGAMLYAVCKGSADIKDLVEAK